jgi:5'-3' exonuclease
MGIPYYIASLLRQHKHIQKRYEQQVEFDALGIDFNCFIHKYLKPDNPIGSITIALEKLLTDIVRAKHVYIAFDGLVPLAKMVQQRYRRMRKPTEEPEFDKHQISPGTPFMIELATSLQNMFPNITISGTDERGEGEHKIFTWLRTLPAEERKSICIYGLDADLVLISIAQSNLGAMQILRETDDDDYAFLSVEGLKNVLPLDADKFVRMSILCFGNDFMPNFAVFSLREDGYTRALYYMQKGDIKHAVNDEKKILRKRAKETDRAIVSTDAHEIETRMSVHLMDGVMDWEPVVYAFRKTFAWVYHYFTTSEILDWEWYYPYPEAPLLATWDSCPATEPFVWDHPEPSFTIQDQLRFILPEKSLSVSGIAPKYPDELYDEETETRPRWMKRFAWECDPYISLPWGKLTSVDEVRLL